MKRLIEQLGDKALLNFKVLDALWEISGHWSPLTIYLTADFHRNMLDFG